jgi:hypothetical protein
VALKAAFNKPDAWLSCHSIPPTYQEPDRGGEYLAVHQQPGEKNDDGSDSWPVYAKPEIETPATDAVLTKLRNEAGARAVELFAKTLGSPYRFRDEQCYEDGFTRAIEIVRFAQAPLFARQLREGADK